MLVLLVLLVLLLPAPLLLLLTPPLRHSNGLKFSTPYRAWFVPNRNVEGAANNSAGASAICMLTATYLHELHNGSVPVGAVHPDPCCEFLISISLLLILK